MLIENSARPHRSMGCVFMVAFVPGRKRIAVLRPRGSLDFSTYRDLIAVGRELHDVGMRWIVLDLGETIHIGYSGLVALHTITVMLQGKEATDPNHGWQAIHALGRHMHKDAQKRLKILNAQPKVAELLQRPCFAQFLDIYPDLDAAIASCRQPCNPSEPQACSVNQLPEPGIQPEPLAGEGGF